MKPKVRFFGIESPKKKKAKKRKWVLGPKYPAWKGAKNCERIRRELKDALTPIDLERWKAQAQRILQADDIISPEQAISDIQSTVTYPDYEKEHWLSSHNRAEWILYVLGGPNIINARPGL